MSYIKKQEPLDKGCIFEAGSAKPYDKEGLLLYRDALIVVFLNRFPYANGHLLLAPSRHIGDINALLPEESSELFTMMGQSIAILRKHYKPAGFNVGLNLGKTAGAGHPDHLHFHIVPRWEGDHNFMTVISEVRTIPQHIENTFDLLLPDFQALISSM